MHMFILVVLWEIKEKNNKRKCDFISFHGRHHYVIRKGIPDHPVGDQDGESEQSWGQWREQVTHRSGCEEGDSGTNVRQTSFFLNIPEEGESQELRNGLHFSAVRYFPLPSTSTFTKLLSSFKMTQMYFAYTSTYTRAHFILLWILLVTCLFVRN